MIKSILALVVMFALLALALGQPPMPEMPGDSDDMFAIMGGELVNLGSKGSFRMPLQLAPRVNAPKYEQLPTETMKPQYLPTVVHTHYVDQDIIQPKTILQPILQQRIVEQPIIRTKLHVQPLARQVKEQTFVRPHIIEQTHIQPVIRQQEILQPKIIEQTTLKQTFQQSQASEQPVTMKATYSGKKGQQLYNTAY